MAFTPGNDINILQGTDTLNVGAGSGNDKYILSPNKLTSDQTVNITDTDGDNVLQIIGGLTIASSKIAANAVQLTLSNGAVVNVFGADSFSYELGGNPLISQPGLVRSFHDFATVSLGGSIPVSGFANGAFNVGINSDGSTATDNQPPTISGTPTLVSGGVAQVIALPDLVFADSDSKFLEVGVSVGEWPGSLGGLVDADPNISGIQLLGSPEAVTTAFQDATVYAYAEISTGVTVTVWDYVNNPVFGTIGVSVHP